MASLNVASQSVTLHYSRPITFRPFRDLIVHCPICAERGKKRTVSRPTINSWGCCHSCGWRLRPGPAPKTKDDIHADAVATQSITPDKSVVNEPTIESITATQEKPYGQLGMRLRKGERKQFTNAKVVD